MIGISKARLGRLIGLSIQTEIVFLSIFGIISTMFDASLVDFSGSLYKVWEIKMDPDRFSERVELYMKYLLTGIVLVRTFTAHIYLGCYILLLYPVLFEERTVLMLPWVVVNAIKCLLTGLVSLAAGIFTCAAYRFAKVTCWEFLLTQFVDHAPSVYMFLLVMSYYKNLNMVLRATQQVDPLELQARRRRTRLMRETTIDSSSSFGDKRDELISVSTIENVVQHLNTKVQKGNSRSLDTLLAQMKDDAERDTIINTASEDKSIGLQGNDSRDAKFLLDKWRNKGSMFSSMFKIPEVYQGRLFANPHYEQYACSVSINALVPYTSLSALLRPLQSKISSDRLKRMVSDVKSIESETEVRSVLPESSINLEVGNDVGASRRTTRNVEIQVQHYSWIQNVDDKKKFARRGKPSHAKETHSQDKVPVTEYYKNKASYQSSYRDDGYTQAFFESIDMNKRNVGKEIT